MYNPQFRLGNDFIKDWQTVRFQLISRVDKGGVTFLQGTAIPARRKREEICWMRRTDGWHTGEKQVMLLAGRLPYKTPNVQSRVQNKFYLYSFMDIPDMKTFTNFFRDAQGRIVIAQWPNYPLWIAIVCFFLTRLSIPLLHDIGFWGLIISLLYWSFLEIVSGVNIWRRFLGLVVALSQFLKLLKLLVPTL